MERYSTSVSGWSASIVKDDKPPRTHPAPQRTAAELPDGLRRAVARRHTGPPTHPTGDVIEERLAACSSCQRFNGRICRLAAGCGALESWATRILYGCTNRVPRSW